MFCSHCGARLGDGARFCPGCGSAVDRAEPTAGAPPTSPYNALGLSGGDPTPPPPVVAAPSPIGGPRRSRTGLVIAICAALVVFVVAVVALAVVVGGSHKTVAAHTKVAPVTSSTTSPAQKAQAAQTALAQSQYKAFIGSMETMLTQSSTGRGGVGTVVSQVANGCAITPADASLQIRAVIDNRTSVLNQLAGLALPSGNADAANLKSMLQTALQDSMQADTYYKEWMDGLNNDYGPYGNYSWCPYSAPTDPYAAYAQARMTDTQSTAAKQAFAAAFNPVAQQFGLQTWDQGQF